MSSHQTLFAELVALLRGLKEINAHAIEASGTKVEVAGSAVLGRLSLLGPSRLTDLAAALGLDPSSVSRQVAAVERAGWVTREEDPTDRRATRLLLTDAGRDVVERLGVLRAEALARLTPDWTDSDLDALTARLARLNHDLAANRALLDAQLESA